MISNAPTPFRGQEFFSTGDPLTIPGANPNNFYKLSTSAGTNSPTINIFTSSYVDFSVYSNVHLVGTRDPSVFWPGNPLFARKNVRAGKASEMEAHTPQSINSNAKKMWEQVIADPRLKGLLGAPAGRRGGGGIPENALDLVGRTQPASEQLLRDFGVYVAQDPRFLGNLRLMLPRWIDREISLLGISMGSGNEITNTGVTAAVKEKSMVRNYWRGCAPPHRLWLMFRPHNTQKKVVNGVPEYPDINVKPPEFVSYYGGVPPEEELLYYDFSHELQYAAIWEIGKCADTSHESLCLPSNEALALNNTAFEKLIRMTVTSHWMSASLLPGKIPLYTPQ